MEWQPIETAPRDGSDILIGGDFSYAGGVLMASCVDGYPHPTFSDMQGDFYNPTHWMPLPEPPK